MEIDNVCGDWSVLVVDDEPGVRSFVKAVLERAGLHVLEAGNGLEALHVLDSAKPDLLLTDIVMPGMDGYALAREAARKSPDLTILIMSGYISAEALEVKAAGFIPKPFQPKTLLHTVTQSLRRDS